MHTSNVWIDKLAMFISQRCALYCWSAVLQRCCRHHWLPPVHRLPPGGDPWLRLRSSTTIDRKDVHLTTDVSSPNPVQCDILNHRHSQLIDLTIRLYTTTSLKSISLKRWLYHQMFKLSSDQFNSQDANHVTSHSSFSLVNCLTTDIYRYDDHKYVNIHRHQFLQWNLKWIINDSGCPLTQS